MEKTAFVALILLFIASLIILIENDYSVFEWDGDRCMTHTKECTCYGFLTELESYPPKYFCHGLDFCKDINLVECE